MKLVSLIILFCALCTAVEIRTAKFQKEPYPFQPQFTKPNGGFASDSTLYLPPESHTSMPYYSMKNTNNLQFQYLPATGTKVPAVYPTPYPIAISSSLVPNFDDDEEEVEVKPKKDDRLTPPLLNSYQNKFNKTDNNALHNERLMSSRTMNYNLPIDRIDIKFPIQSGPAVTTPFIINHMSADRRASLMSSDTVQRNEQAMDHIKAASYANSQFVQPPAYYPTTEPAIPILRLSNEMDLDGSFSYEALGADQTHYEQHSRMENMGTDKEEQVVEGSYSYVGDNGKTYTVHYVADGNGYRATGDHLPVAPPMPEIIHRAVQYNLAEEAKRPSQLKLWQDDEIDDINDDKATRFGLPPPRNLFTGKTPEAFSFSFGTQNNMMTSASSQIPVKTHIEASKDQPKTSTNNGPTPQVTFLASQGAQLPSNSVQQSISRMNSNERPMPQLMNYQSNVKVPEQDNKSLWMWQYGLNANNVNQKANKNSISRSSGEGDDIMINFNDMTADDYSKMLNAQIEPIINNHNVPFLRPDLNQFDYLHSSPPSSNEIKNQIYLQESQKQELTSIVRSREEQNLKATDNLKVNTPNDQFHFENQEGKLEYERHNQQENKHLHQVVLNIDNYPSHLNSTSNRLNNEFQVINSQPEYKETIDTVNKKNTQHINFNSPIIHVKNLIPPSQTVTRSYDYEDNYYEPRKIKTSPSNMNSLYSFSSLQTNNNEPQLKSSKIMNYEVKPNDLSTPISVHQTSTNFYEEFISSTTSPFLSTNEYPHIISTSATYSTSIPSLKFSDFIENESKENFKPITTTTTTESAKLLETSTSIGDILRNNIFLKNIIQSEKREPNSLNQINEENKINYQTKTVPEQKEDVAPKVMQYYPKPAHDIIEIKKKPVDISNILNYVQMKNGFESAKTKPKSKDFKVHDFRLQKNTDMRYIPLPHEELANKEANSNRHFKEELRGIIKNYKVLHRNNNIMQVDKQNDDGFMYKRELNPKLLQVSNLPPLGRAGPSIKTYLPPIYV